MTPPPKQEQLVLVSNQSSAGRGRREDTRRKRTHPLQAGQIEAPKIVEGCASGRAAPEHVDGLVVLAGGVRVSVGHPFRFAFSHILLPLVHRTPTQTT
jgi:hypothetical protein